MANKYCGEKCIVCGEVFDDGQDIVVCPDCGTPYHRDCWDQNGECVNTSLHESGEEWKPAPKISVTAPVTEEPIRCIRCGTENEAGRRFCGECGLPLTVNRDDPRYINNGGMYNADSFNTSHNNGNTDFTPFGAGGFPTPMPNMIKLTPQSDMDGIKLGDMITYIGNRSLGMIANFVRFAKTGQRLSFNLAALLFPHVYFFYRKMYKTGIFFLLLLFLFNIPSLIYGGQMGTITGGVLFNIPIDLKGDRFMTILQACTVLDLMTRIFAASYANYWYYKKTREDITDIRSADPEPETDEEAVNMIRVKGGTSWPGVAAAFIADLLLELSLLLGMALLYP